MSQSYEEKLDEFVEGKAFSRLPRPVRDRADAWCDACGSLEPRLLFGLKEDGTDRYFFVGAECLREISQRGVVRRAFRRENINAAFGEEMARRKIAAQENAESVDPVPSVGCQDSTQASGVVAPQVNFFQTDESYIALAQMWHEGSWIWGRGEVPRLREIWEPNNGYGLILKRIPRDPSDAMAQCARTATEEVLSKLAEQSQKQSNPCGAQTNSLGNGHDWTGFWKSVKDMGLDQQEVVQLAGGFMPKQWLERHGDHDLEDLLDMIRWKREQQIVPALATGAGQAS